MMKLIPIGISDFRKLREADLEYIDKSQIIERILADRGGEVFLFPRPRRFGKTLNLSMLRYFLERSPEDLSSLFAGLRIWEAGPSVRNHFQRYPVIFLTFKDLKPTSLELWRAGLAGLLQELYAAHYDLLEGDTLMDWERERFQAIVNGRASESVLQGALKGLTTWLHRRHGERVVVLIDEYDSPIHVAQLLGFGDEVLQFFRVFLGSGLKDNPHLFKGIITGILRVARENVFSGLNNLKVYGLLREEYADCFGFTEPEVQSLLERADQGAYFDVVRTWYNGYLFGEQVIYNPWSVLSFVENRDKAPQAYWLNTSSNDLVRDLLARHALQVEPDMRRLLDGTPIEKSIDENVVLTRMREDVSSLWSLLLFSGYLKAERLESQPEEEPRYALSLPNLEVRKIYLTTFQRWLEAQLPGRSADVAGLLRAMFEGDSSRLEQYLEDLARSILSTFDQGGRHPEAVYHGFLLGLCAVLEGTHRVRSNRESGRGRPDVLILPRHPGQPGVVLELKVARPGRKTLEQALEEGLEQLRTRDYQAELRAAGAAPIHAFAVAFDGKTVRVADAASGADTTTPA